MYIMSSQFIAGVLSLDIATLVLGKSIKEYGRRIRSGYTLFRIFSQENFMRPLYYSNVPCITAFFLLFAEFNNSPDFPEIFIGLPFALAFLSWFLVVCTGCGEDDFSFG